MNEEMPVSEQGSSKRIVIALGGNAIQRVHQRGTAHEQLENLRLTCQDILGLIKQGHKIIITHGNGPQIGNLLIQQEETKARVPAHPMDLCVAMTQGQIGYLLQQVLLNVFKAEMINQDVLTVVTQVMVDSEDSAFMEPTKPIGPYYDPETKARYEREKGYAIERVKPSNDCHFRRVVPSPNPLRILEARAIKRLVDAGVIIVASGGGGIPVAMDHRGNYYGIEAVVDKDLAGEKLAEAVMADILIILTDVEKVYLKFGTPQQSALDIVRLDKARAYLEEGHFSSGSMAPKVDACIRFLEFGGERAIIAALNNAALALEGKTGTHFLP